MHEVITIWFIFATKNLHALDFNRLEERIPRNADLDVMRNLQLFVTAITFGFSVFISLMFFSTRVRGKASTLEG